MNLMEILYFRLTETEVDLLLGFFNVASACHLFKLAIYLKFLGIMPIHTFFYVEMILFFYVPTT